jgi:hypothetical protein
MSELTGSTFNLPYNLLITAKVSAKNLKGWSTLSQSNTIGALVEVIPSAVNTPANGVQTTETQVDVTWAPLTT